MSSIPIENTDMIVEEPKLAEGDNNENIQPLVQLQKNVPNIVVTMEEERPGNPQENKDNDFRSVFGESDIISIVEDRNDSDKDQSGGDTKNKPPKKCFNKKCDSTRDLKKIKSRVIPGKFRIFCKSCYQNYAINQFCEFCEQVYDNSAFNQQDDNNWMGCDSCERWNHVHCQYQKRNKHAYQIKQRDDSYLCVECTDKKAIKTQSRRQKPFNKQSDYYLYDKPPTTNKRSGRVFYNQQKNGQYYNPNMNVNSKSNGNTNKNSVSIFKRPREVNLYLDSFLHSVNNFKLSISDTEIRQDFRKINGILKQPSRTNYGYEKTKNRS